MIEQRAATRDRDGVPSEVILTLEGECVHHFREMVRQQLLGDLEVLRDCVAGREDPERRLELGTRIEFLRELAVQVALPTDPERRRDPGRVRYGTVPPRPTGWRLHVYKTLLGMK